jgi:hypothetical protein
VFRASSKEDIMYAGAQWFTFGTAATAATGATGVSNEISSNPSVKGASAYLSTGSATIIVQGSISGTDYWQTIDTLTLSGAGGVDCMDGVTSRAAAYFDRFRVNVSAISTGTVKVRWRHSH